MADLDRLLRSDIAAVAAEQARTPGFDTIERRGLQRRRRRTGLVTAVLAAAAVFAVVAGSQLLPGRQDAAPTYPVDRPTQPWKALRSPGQVVSDRAVPWLDPADTTDGAVDIRRVLVSRGSDAGSLGEFTIDLAESYPGEGRLDALGRIIEYGVVIDTDGDLRPDCHMGISNDNDTTAEPVDLHVWLKNLRTGVADDRLGGPYGYPFDFVHPGQSIPDGHLPPRMQFSFLNGTPTPCDAYGPGDHFYVYSSLTQNGQVTTWDFAPDKGWLGFR